MAIRTASRTARLCRPDDLLRPDGPSLHAHVRPSPAWGSVSRLFLVRLSEVRTYGSASAVTSWDARSRSSVRLSGWVEGVFGIRATRPPVDDRTECPMHVYVMAWVFVHYMNLEWFGILTSICMPHTVVCRAPQPRPQMRPYTIPTQPCGGSEAETERDPNHIRHASAVTLGDGHGGWSSKTHAHEIPLAHAK